ncbi:MAG: rRNA maturation RNase YbeY [Candidatus Obscuribacterales bacterium]|nr:rRNA maturation RNase YbeY [Candidatus Obscuribacterales bacterium]
MASQVTVSNRQRRVKIDGKWFAGTAQKLFEAVLENVKLRPGKGLTKGLAKKLQESAQLSVVLVSNKEIQKLNKTWMGKDYATDVLSFPLDLEEHLPGLPYEIGELVISLEKAQEQAGEYGHSFERELAFLFVHGCLHVLGFDHMNAKDEKDMFGRQKEILDACGFPRK